MQNDVWLETFRRVLVDLAKELRQLALVTSSEHVLPENVLVAKRTVTEDLDVPGYYAEAKSCLQERYEEQQQSLIVPADSKDVVRFAYSGESEDVGEESEDGDAAPERGCRGEVERTEGDAADAVP